MPETEIQFFRDVDGRVPVRDWIRALRRTDKRAAVQCLGAVERLTNLGHELRRPHADYLRDGIYELRVKVGRVNYRILYFFHGKDMALLAHGLTKEKRVPPGEIDRAVKRRQAYESDPVAHRHKQELSDV